MRIAIITLPLHTNYGGVLQAYALKTVLEGMGHTAEVIDREAKLVMPSKWKMPLVYLKRIFLNIVSFGSGPEVFRERRVIREFPEVSSVFGRFADDYISPRVLSSYRQIDQDDYDAFIVGSDQVWRPKYFGRIQDAFLDFTSGWDVRRLSYAASFGTDQLEYTYEQLDDCSRLLKIFDAVSVRENSAVALCEDWLDYEGAAHVMDPVMLLDADHYAAIAGTGVTGSATSKALTYILDRSEAKKAVVDRISSWFDNGVYDVSVYPRDRELPLSDRVVPSMQSWLSCFHDAEFIITDSFHGCIMALLFHKPFVVLGNPGRGMTRILSLLEKFSLEDRLIHGLDPDDDGKYYMAGIDWESVDDVLNHWKGISMRFLENSLNDRL